MNLNCITSDLRIRWSVFQSILKGLRVPVLGRIFLLCILTASSADAAVTVTTQFRPEQVYLGDTAQYQITIRETSSSRSPEAEEITTLPITETNGLTLRNARVGTPRKDRVSVNFKTEYGLTQFVIVDATAPRTGNFTIPSFTLSYKGKTYTAPAATLSIIERPDDAPPPINELIFLKIDAPSKLYLGQTTLMNLKLYVHEQARYRGYDDFKRKADGFTISDLTDGIESIELVGKYRYQVLTWPLVITPVQSGTQDLNFEFSVVAEVPQQRARQDPFGRSSPFGHSLFNNFFTRSERFNLFNEPTQIEVLPLPTKGKPESFSGAIGDFNIQVTSDAQDARVDEPIMLSLKVSGTGNFERISGPQLAESSDWRAYEPESTMEPDEANPLKGIKRFDYVFIPQKTGKRMLPEVKFSFFDPEESTYVELTAPPISVDVSPSLTPRIPTPSTAHSTESTTEPNDYSIALNHKEAMLTLDYRPQPSSPIGIALVKQPSFYLFNCAALMALIFIGSSLRRRRRLRTDLEYAQQEAARAELKAALSATKTAEAQGETVDFYNAAQEAIRLSATLRFSKNLRLAEFNTLKQLFHAHALPEEAKNAAQQLFNTADELRFSGKAINTTDLKTARQQLDILLKAL